MKQAFIIIRNTLGIIIIIAALVALACLCWVCMGGGVG